MSNVRLTWTLPPVTPRQYSIDYTRIEFRVSDTLPWTEQDVVPASNPQELLFVDVQPGSFFYRATVVDTEGNEGPPVETSIVLAFDPPGSVTDFIATEE